MFAFWPGLIRRSSTTHKVLSHRAFLGLLSSQDEQHIIVTGRDSSKLTVHRSQAASASARDQMRNSTSTSSSSTKEDPKEAVQQGSGNAEDTLHSSEVTTDPSTRTHKSAALGMEQLATVGSLAVTPTPTQSSALDTASSLLSAVPAADDPLQAVSSVSTKSSSLTTSQPPRLLRTTDNDRSAAVSVLADAVTNEVEGDGLGSGLEKDEVELALELMDAGTTLEAETAQGQHAESGEQWSAFKVASQLSQGRNKGVESKLTLASGRRRNAQVSSSASGASGSGAGARDGLQETDHAAARYRIDAVSRSGDDKVVEVEQIAGQIRQLRHATEGAPTAGQIVGREGASRAVLQKEAAKLAAKLAVTAAITQAVPATTQQQAISLLLQQYGITFDMPAAALTAANAPVAR